MTNTLVEARHLAVQDCLAHQARTQCEYGIFLDPAGNRLLEQAGSEEQVELTEDDSKCISSNPGGLFIHNHPEGGPLSQQDIASATYSKCEVWAVTEDGSCYASRGLTIGRQPSYAEGAALDAAIRHANRDFKSHVRVHFGEVHELEFLWSDDLSNAREHFKLCRMRDAGLLDYRYQLSRKVEAAFQKLGLEIGNSQEIVLHDERELA